MSLHTLFNRGRRQLKSARRANVLSMAEARGNFFEALETRQLMAASAAVDTDNLRISGTESADRITVSSFTQTSQVTRSGVPTTITVPMLQVRVTDAAGNVRLDDAGNEVNRAFLASGINNIYVNGLGGSDTIDTSATSKTVIAYAGSGNDVIKTGAGSDMVYGEAGADRATLGGGDDYFNGGIGNDTAYGGNGADLLLGGADRDSLYGESGNDELNGETGDDRLLGSSGNDVLRGGSGNDLLFGESGTADQIFGDAGNDWMDTGSASESATGGDGTADWNARVWAINGIATTDVSQQQSGTCVFLSALASAARNFNLADRITYLGNFTYRVQLFDFWKNPVNTEVTFDGSLNFSDGSLVDPASAVEGEFWTVLFQRAYLKQFFNITTPQGMADFGGEMNGEQAIRALTGRNTWTNGRNFGFNVEALMDEIARGEAINAGGTGHRYAITHVVASSAAGGYTVTLYNPWGIDAVHDDAITFSGGSANDGIITLSWTEFNDNFTNYSTSW